MKKELILDKVINYLYKNIDKYKSLKADNEIQSSYNKGVLDICIKLLALINSVLNKSRSSKQNALYWQVMEYYGHDIFHTLDIKSASKRIHEVLKDNYAFYILKQEPIKVVVLGMERVYFNFSISFDKLDNIEANKYYEWAFEFILEAVNKDRDVKLVEIMDYVEECKRGFE